MKKFTLFLTALLACQLTFAQKVNEIKLNAAENTWKVKTKSALSLEISNAISTIRFVENQTKSGNFVSIETANLIKTYNEGFPNIPVFSKLIEVPQDAQVKFNIVRYDEEIINLADHGINAKIMPAQRSISKSEDPEKIEFAYKQEIYNQDRYINTEIARYEESGMLRHTRLGRIEISPIQYNPVKNSLRVLNNLVIEIVFDGANLAKTNDLKTKYASPYFENIYAEAINHVATDKALITAEPPTFVIVSAPMFQTQLQPFIQWKKKKGFHVIEAYTNNPSVGTTTTSIKNYLQGLYNSPAPGVNPPSFVLLCGDVAQIPAYAGTAGSHPTDLYYFEYTGDKIPEVFYGRWSATSTAQMQPQIDKTLEYEMFTMPDPAYLGKAVMVAGDDASYEMTYGNGQINYGTTYYFNNTNGISSYTYLQPLDNNLAGTQIRQNVSDGVGYGNYTAHCSPAGWATPTFEVSHISSLNNAHKYGLLVGNCCLSNKFDEDACFGEALLRAADKGAIGYIGGSNSTYWDEDYWWGVGLTSSISANPTYAGSGLGAYDRMFHTHGEATSDWFITQDQMVVGGNLANEASSSSRKTYYWEIYHLMGDPSLMPYMGVPEPMTVVASPSTLLVGMTSLTVTSVPYAYVALSQNGTIIDVAMSNASGVANLTFSPLTNVGTADLVITAQNKRPYIGTIDITPSNQPYVVLNSYSINDASGNNNGALDYNESAKLNVNLQNVAANGSGYDASNVIAKLRTNSPYIILIDSLENYGTINAGAGNNINNAFEIAVSSDIPDQTAVSFLLHVSGEYNSTTYYWDSPFTINVNAPAFTIGNLTIDDAAGNNDGILDAGETANIVIANTNSGHADVAGCIATIASASPYITINTNTYNVGAMSAGGNADAIFSVTADPSTPLATPATFTYSISEGAYSATANKDVVIGLIPDYPMANSTVTACVGTFYDSGGPNNQYQSNESFVMTFLPTSPSKVLSFNFTSFVTETNYDYLYIYNGTSTSAPQITGSPFHGTTSPGTIQATNPQGAFTFKFTSDASITDNGWVATINCISLTDPPACAASPVPANGANLVNPLSPLSWSAVSGASSYDVYIGETLPTVPTANVTATTYAANLNPNTTYYWKVVPKNAVGDAVGCATWSFTTGEMPTEITIGNGTVQSQYYPFYTYYENNKTQMLFKQTELGGAKTITTLGFDFSFIGTTINAVNNLTISFKHTNLSTFGTAYADMTGSTTVYTNANYSLPLATGWQDIDITDFAYNGTDNLIIEVVWGDNGAYSPSSGYYKVNCTDYSSGSSILVTYGYADSETPPNYDGNSKVRPNIKLSYATTGSSTIVADKANEINIFPNPNKGIFQLEVPFAGKTATHYAIYNMQNQLIVQDKLNNSSSYMKLDYLPNGVYYIRVTSKEHTIVKQFVIQ